MCDITFTAQKFYFYIDHVRL